MIDNPISATDLDRKAPMAENGLRRRVAAFGFPIALVRMVWLSSRSHRLRCLLPLLAVLLGCSEPERVVIAQPPLDRIVYHRRTIVVYPAAGVDWKSLVDLRIFETLRPGMNFEEARARLGPPSLASRNSMGPYIAYLRPWGSLRVGHERQASGDASFEFWSLRAYPTHWLAKDFFHPSILKYLDPHLESSEVFLTREGYTQAQVVLNGLRVEDILWLKD